MNKTELKLLETMKVSLNNQYSYSVGSIAGDCGARLKLNTRRIDSAMLKLESLGLVALVNKFSYRTARLGTSCLATDFTWRLV